VSTTATPVNEEEIVAARNVLRSVMASSSRSASPGLRPVEHAPVSVGVQTDTVMPPSSLEGLIRAAGFSLANFANEIKTLERRIDSQHAEVLHAIRELKHPKEDDIA
jgi:hypothetical protein